MTARSDRHARTLPFAKLALHQIERLGLPADPQNFELWYLYATGRDQILNKAIDAALMSSEGLTEVELDRLFNAHISSARSASRLNAIATDLSDEISQVMGMIGAAAASSEIYDEHLGLGLHEMAQIEGHQAIRPIIEALVTATKEMEMKSRDLEERLDESRINTIELQKDVESLRLENLTDPLTLIGNRQYFEDSLVKMTEAARVTRAPLCLLFADIDRFKEFNDSFGHQVGDQVLRLVASTIKVALRDGDVAARYGGEEFAIILPGAPLSTGKMAAERLRTAIMAREITKRSTHETLGRITTSIGVAQFHHGEAPEELIGRADACLYTAKRCGRNRVVSEHDAEFTVAENGAAQLLAAGPHL